MIDISTKTGINIERLKTRMTEMAQVGATDKGGVSRLALTEEDRDGRKLLIKWMREIGLKTRVDDMATFMEDWREKIQKHLQL